MKVVQMNITCSSGSTGKICLAISKHLFANGIENYILFSSGTSEYEYGIKYMRDVSVKLEAFRSHLSGMYGFCSQVSTRRVLRILDKIQPDIVCLHNLHGHNCNLSMLFAYLKKKNIKVFWVFHDCWAFTAYCPHFSMISCEKWKEKCTYCPEYKKYSFFFDKSDTLFERKKSLAEGIDLTVITPSEWLAGVVKQSVYRNYPVKVINNGIDVSVFKPTDSDFREKYQISPQKTILLGVAFDWSVKKGLDVFLELFERLDNQKYQIVMVGTNSKIDTVLPKGIISIHRTENQRQLAEIYTAADIFVNPTREEVFGLVNVEANACGTPVITFASGGSPECIDEKSGIAVPRDDVDALVKAIVYTEENRPFSAEMCRNRAVLFAAEKKYAEYAACFVNHE